MPNVLPTGRRAFTRRRVVIGVTSALALGTAGGTAYAAWAVTASGSSAARSSTVVAGTVTSATPVASLYPGGSTALYFTVSNPNGFPVTYTAADFGTVTVDNSTACPATNVTVTDQTLSIAVAANTTSVVQAPIGSISMSSTAPDGCQGRTFTVATTLTGTSG